MTDANIETVAQILACEIECGIFEQHVIPALDVVRKTLLDAGAAPRDAQDAERYRKCKEHAIKRGLFEKPEEYDAMVDESIERMEVAFHKGHNYGKKMQPNGSLVFPDNAASAPAEHVQARDA